MINQYMRRYGAWCFGLSLYALLGLFQPGSVSAEQGQEPSPAVAPESDLIGAVSASEVYTPLNRGWLQVDIGIIGAASSDVLSAAMEEVREQGYQGLVIRLDTPGGALDATRSMVKQMLASPFPILVWVGSSGARAGSAGAFITLAANIASMAPGTNIGAAHPVQSSGQDIEQGDLKDKIENDTIAFMESIADIRKRNKEMAVSFVVNSVSITAEDALANNVIDLIADSPKDLLEKVNGRKLVLAGNETVLNTEGFEIFVYEKNLRQRFLEILSNPNIFYLLFIAGLIGLGIELTNPGVLVPGVLGAISLVLALIATSVLPVNFGAMLLILVAVAFMVAEMFIPSFGILGIGGFAAFIAGSLLLVDSSEHWGLAISWTTILPTALAVAGVGVAIFYLVIKVERSKVQSGSESMVGSEAIAVQDFIDGRGQVRLNGEYWRAKSMSNEFVSKGDRLEVRAINGLELTVSSKSSLKG